MCVFLFNEQSTTHTGSILLTELAGCHISVTNSASSDAHRLLKLFEFFLTSVFLCVLSLYERVVFRVHEILDSGWVVARLDLLNAGWQSRWGLQSQSQIIIDDDFSVVFRQG